MLGSEVPCLRSVWSTSCAVRDVEVFLQLRFQVILELLVDGVFDFFLLILLERPDHGLGQHAGADVVLAELANREHLQLAIFLFGDLLGREELGWHTAGSRPAT